MKAPAYPSYRASNLPWLGPLPTHWQVRRLKTLFTRASRPAREDDGIVTAFRDGQVTLRRNRREEGFTNSIKEIGYQGVRRGDLVIHAMDAFAGAIGVSDADGKSTPVYSACIPESDVDADYYALLLRHMALSGFVSALSRGVRERSTEFRWADASVLNLPHPPLEEQQDIVSFLRRETATIDALVAAQRRLIEILKEKRQAVISHAVTKGLDPSVPMKESGVEWLGEVPAHWSIKRLKHIAARVVDCLHTTPTYDGVLQYPAIRTADVDRGILRLDQARLVSREIYQERIQRLRPEAGDILYSREGERFGMAALVPSGVDLCLGQRMMMFRLRSEFDPTYIMWVLNSESIFQQVLETVGGATSPHINISDIVNFYMPAPNMAEQRQIAAGIQAQVSQIDKMLAEAEKGNNLLHEHRAALISAAVTGKIDVRHTAEAPLTMESRRLRLVVGATIVEAIAGEPSYGRTKMHKIAFLAQKHAGVHELEGVYLRQAAGPLDQAMLDEMEGELQKAGHLSVQQPDGRGSPVTYTLLGRRGAFRGELEAALGLRTVALDNLISHLSNLNLHAVEAIATLYAVWNDFLIDGQTPTDDMVIRQFLEDRHPKKAENFIPTELHTWLGWMRHHGLVPKGQGQKTIRDRLFA